MSDLLVRGIDREAGLRIIAAVTSDLVAEAARRHEVGGVGACALGRALTSSLLVATLSKAGERVTLQFQSDGPIRGIVVDAHVDPAESGDARGYLVRPDQGALQCRGRCRVVQALGRNGVLNVVRDLGLRDRYQGQIALLTGEVDEDVEAYLTRSEQVPSAIGCDVVFDGDRVLAAAGVMVQALPGGDFDSVRPSQHALRTGAVFDFLRERLVPEHAAPVPDAARALAEAIYGRSIEWLGEQPLRFRCRCSQQRVTGMLGMLTTVDIDEIIAEQGEAEVICNFCNTRYVIARPELERIREQLAHGPRANN